ncbi:MAG: TraX family protein [Phormidesmis sp.]
MAKSEAIAPQNSPLHRGPLTAFDIKIIAAVTMLVDHIGALFFPEQLIFRVIGRISFPLFAWLAAQGQAHTQNLLFYLIRLLLLGVISQPIYDQALHLAEPSYSFQLNILFTLALGVAFISVLKAARHWWLKAALWILGWVLDVAMLDTAAPIEGGFWAVTVVWFMSKLRDNAGQSRFWWYGFYVLLSTVLLPSGFAWRTIPRVLAPLIVFGYSGEQGRKAKWFYGFYPLHFAVLVAIRLML